MLEYQRKSLKISLTPLIDVVFIMLLFFMLASTFTHWQQIPLSSVASARASTSDTPPAQLIVLGDRQVEYKGTQYTLEDSSFQKLLQDFKNETVRLLITASSQANIQDVVMVMDNALAAGLDQVNLTRSIEQDKHP